MSLRSLALGWQVDGWSGVTLLAAILGAGVVYLRAARRGARNDRRGRAWPRGRSACFVGGLLALVVDLYSGIGAQADARLSVHMVEHMVVWVVVAPLLAAGAPMRLAFYALGRGARQGLARALRSRAVAVASSPVCSVSAFAAAVLVTHLPAVYGLALENQYVHELEHALYLVTALLVWAPLLGADPLPHRAGPRGQLISMTACMVPMALVALWLGSASNVVYAHYHGTAALHDQRVAALVMWAGGLPAFLLPALSGRRLRFRLRSARVVV